MRLQEDYIENIEHEDIKLEEPKIEQKDVEDYHFSIYVSSTSVTQFNADKILEKLSYALDQFPNILQHAERYYW